MNSDTDKYEVLYCFEDDEYRVYCDICDKFCTGRQYKDHRKSRTHTKTFHKRLQNNLVI